MPKVMFQVITLGLEGIVVLVFDFPAGSSHLGKLNNIDGSNGMVGHKAVLIQNGTCSFMGDDQLEPIDEQGIVAIA
jgi:hypothetical protein